MNVSTADFLRDLRKISLAFSLFFKISFGVKSVPSAKILANLFLMDSFIFRFVAFNLVRAVAHFSASSILSRFKAEKNSP